MSIQSPSIKQYGDDKQYQDARLKRLPQDACAKEPLSHAAPIIDPRDLGPLFARRSCLLGDDETLYDDLLSKITAAFAPRDFIEAIWVKEFADRIWDGQFYQSVRAGFLTEAQKDVVNRLVQLDDRVIAQWIAGDRAARTTVEKALKERGLDWDTVTCQAFSNKLDKIEQFDGLIERANTRRDKALHNLERRRERGTRPNPQVIDGLRADRPITR
jgi:hypothetical protein